MLDFLADVFEGVVVVVGCFGVGVVVMVAVGGVRGVAASNGAVFFGHVGADEYRQE